MKLESFKNPILGKVTDDGRFLPHNRGQIKKEFAKYSGCDVAIVIQKIGGITFDDLTEQLKSREQLGYFYGAIVPLLMEEWGYERADELVDDLKREFFFEYGVDKVSGKEVRRLKSFADAFWTDFRDFLDRVISWLQTSHNITVPSPEQYKVMSNEE